MKHKILLHDCEIESSSLVNNELTINFSQLLVVNVRTEFGFNLDLNDSDYYSGKFKIKNPTIQGKLEASEVADGYLQLPEYKYDLLPLDFKAARSVLVLTTSHGDLMITGDSFQIEIGEICK